MLGTMIRRSAKAAVLPAGLMSRRRPGDLVILLYHRLGEDPAEIALSVPAFERQVRYLSAAGARSLDGALADDDGGLVVSFDDGTVDFIEHALPLLVRYGVPALLYLATGGVERNGGSGSGLLTWSQLADAVATGLVTVGSHTHGHVDLSVVPAAEAEAEMRRSKDLIEDRLGVPCRHFSYPWGVASPAAEAIARGLFSTAALGWGTNRRGGFDRHRLDRTPILRSDGQVFFRAKVAGRLDAEARVYQVLGRGPWRKR